MKKFKIFLSISLFFILTLWSCNKEKDVIIDSNQTWTVDSTGLLEEINSEVENNENSANNENWSSGSLDSKVVKINKTYVSPGWNDEIEFSIKTNWDKIENVSVNMVKWSEISTKLATSFWEWINSVIVWKTIEEAKNIDTVWWASLTTNAFKEALKDI